MGVGHFGHKTFWHHNIGAEVSGHIAPGSEAESPVELCLVGIVLGSKCPDFSSSCLGRVRSVLWPKYLVTIVIRRVCWLVRSFINYARCDFSNTGPILTTFDTDAGHHNVTINFWEVNIECQGQNRRAENRPDVID